MPNTPTPARFSSLAAGAAMMLVAALLTACGGSRKEPEALPSQTVTQITPQLEPPPLPPPLPPIREVRPSKPSVKVIDPGGKEDTPTTLVEASRLARQVKRDAKEPIAEINDENLAEYAEGGDIIILTSEPAAPAPRLEPPPTVRADALDAPRVTAVNGTRDEQYWRNRALELRMGWRRTVDTINSLELEAAALRQQFYAEEDTYLRDSQIKPSWDRALDRLGQLRERSQRYEQELELFVDEGRRSGAEQGWLNEGWELEPSSNEKEHIEQFKPKAHEPINTEPLAEAENAS